MNPKLWETWASCHKGNHCLFLVNTDSSFLRQKRRLHSRKLLANLALDMVSPQFPLQWYLKSRDHLQTFSNFLHYKFDYYPNNLSKNLNCKNLEKKNVQPFICPPFASMTSCTGAGTSLTSLSKTCWSMLSQHDLTMIQWAMCVNERKNNFDFGQET